MKSFLKRFRKRRQLEQDLEDELRFHLEMKAEETGNSRDARLLTGNISALKEDCRDIWTYSIIESLWKDFRYGLRALPKSPGVTVTALLALALGIGANTAVFTIVNAALSYDLGVDQPERLVLVSVTDQARRIFISHSYRDFHNLRNQVKSVESLAAYRFVPVNVSDQSGLPERFSCVAITANGFQVMRRRPVFGREFGPEDELPGAAPVVLLTDHIWQNRYGRDPSILGKTIRVDGVPRQIIGVMQAGMRFPEDTDLWVPLTPRDGQAHTLYVFGRLSTGVTLAAARSEMEVLARRLVTMSPDVKGPIIGIQPFLEIIGVYQTRSLFYTMLGAVGFVLLIACADVANLLLARAVARSREISIRLALGAGQGRVVRQLLTESLILSLAGGFLGWLVALGGLRWFDAATSKFPRPSWVDLSMNPRVFAYLAAISIGTGILFGLAPSLRLRKVDVHSRVKDGGHGAANAIRGRYLSNSLVSLEMALCAVLLAGAGLMIRSSLNLYGAPLGVNPANVLTAEIVLAEAKYPQPRDRVSFHQRLKERLESLPGVESAAVASTLPLHGWLNLTYQVDSAPNGQPSVTGGLIVTADYFHVLQVHPSYGRLFSEDAAEAVVNESFAAKLGSRDDVIGKRIHLMESLNFREQWLTVVGIVPNIQQDLRALLGDPLIYVPYTASPRLQAVLIARTRVPPATLASAFRREAQEVDRNLPLSEVRTLENVIAQNRLEVGAVSAMFTIFAAIALVLASIGIYAVIAHAVSQRTREIGVRIAVGGSKRDVLRLVFMQGMRPLLFGLGFGLPAAFGLTRVLRGTLVGVTPGDPLTFAAVVIVLAAAGFLGCAIPARRAVRVDPVIALRCD